MWVNERFNGDGIYFTIRNTIYEGRVVEGVSADEVRVLLDDRSHMVINVDRIAGTLIDYHPDLKTQVVMRGDRNTEDILHGEIEAVYDDGVRKIDISLITYTDGSLRFPDQPRIYFVHEDTEYLDGGYVTGEEFAELQRN